MSVGSNPTVATQCANIRCVPKYKPKMPPYAELKRLVVDEHWSYRKVALKYGVHHDSVYQKLRDGARLNGDAWPLQRDLQKTQRRGLSEASISSHGVAYIVNERINQEAPPRSAKGPVLIGVAAAKDHAPRTRVYYAKGRVSRHFQVWPKKIASYHFADCSSMRGKPTFTIDAEEALDWGYASCATCLREKTITQWCNDYGLSVTYISKLLNGVPTIRITQAVRILTALDEPLTPLLRKYRTRVESVDDHKRGKPRPGPTKRKAKKAA